MYLSYALYLNPNPIELEFFMFIKPVPEKLRKLAAEKTANEFPDYFPTIIAARRFLSLIILPPSKKWAFISTGKNASSSTLNFLFHAEFNTHLNANFSSPTDINPEAVVHKLADVGVFSRAILLGMTATELLQQENMERICIVRNPYERAASSFRYFCQSNEAGLSWFLTDRLRANAMGFDWDTMPYTEKGFRIFLEYIEATIEALGVDMVDGHWRPQIDVIKPKIFQPTLVGRMENMDVFFTTLADRLNTTHEASENLFWKNRQTDPLQDGIMNAAIRKKMESIYKQDFEEFGY
jgi:hypothetical protein